MNQRSKKKKKRTHLALHFAVFQLPLFVTFPNIRTHKTLFVVFLLIAQLLLHPEFRSPQKKSILRCGLLLATETHNLIPSTTKELRLLFVMMMRPPYVCLPVIFNQRSISVYAQQQHPCGVCLKNNMSKNERNSLIGRLRKRTDFSAEAQSDFRIFPPMK